MAATTNRPQRSPDRGRTQTQTTEELIAKTVFGEGTAAALDATALRFQWQPLGCALVEHALLRDAVSKTEQMLAATSVLAPNLGIDHGRAVEKLEQCEAKITAARAVIGALLAGAR